MADKAKLAESQKLGGTLDAEGHRIVQQIDMLREDAQRPMTPG